MRFLKARRAQSARLCSEPSVGLAKSLWIAELMAINGDSAVFRRTNASAYLILVNGSCRSPVLRFHGLFPLLQPWHCVKGILVKLSFVFFTTKRDIYIIPHQAFRYGRIMAIISVISPASLPQLNKGFPRLRI